MSPGKDKDCKKHSLPHHADLVDHVEGSGGSRWNIKFPETAPWNQT